MFDIRLSQVQERIKRAGRQLVRAVAASKRLSPSNPHPYARLLWIVVAVILGTSLTVMTIWFLNQGCTNGSWCGSLRSGAAANPPWTLITAILLGPALMLSWWWRTLHKDQSHETSKRCEQASRFFDAVRLLADNRLEVQFGAIYSLESLALNSDEECVRVLDTLCALLRTHGATPPSNLPPTEIWRQPAQVQACFTVVGRLQKRSIRIELRGARLNRIDGIDAYLCGADLSQANLSRANLSRANLSRANLTDAHLTDAHLLCANLSEANLTDAHLSDAELSGAQLAGANLSHANFSGANLSHADLSHANLSRADLSRADLFCANLSGADLTDANLSGANLSSANLSDANLSSAHLLCSHLSSANLKRANLSSANLSDADLLSADLSGAHLSDAHLSGARLSDAHLSNANLTRANLESAEWSTNTAFPIGLNPVAAGMILVDARGFAVEPQPNQWPPPVSSRRQ